MPELPSLDHITLTDRPLIVCDIDEVVLEFLSPLRRFLNASGRDLLPRSFRLHGNIVDLETGEPVADGRVKPLLEDFFRQQEDWQCPAPQAVETLASLSSDADIVFLTAMSAEHTAARRALLDRHGLHYPLLASLEPKGPTIRRLHAARRFPLVFLDDILRNLQSVRAHAPECLLINMMANDDFRAMAPEPGEGIATAGSWADAATLIRAHFDVER